MLISIKRFFGKSRSDHPSASQMPEQIISRIQEGDERLRQQFLAEHQSYVAEVASQICNKPVEPAKDPEYTLAFAAFADSIDRFDPQSESSFFEYVEGEISERLSESIDRNGGFISPAAIPSFKPASKPPMDKQQTDKPQDNLRIQERQSEIKDLEEVLGQFGMEWSQWADESPKTEKLSQELFAASQILARDPELMRQLLKERKLPLKPLAAASGQSRNMLERHRHYIVALAVLMYGPFPNLRSYLRMDLTSPAAEEGRR